MCTITLTSNLRCRHIEGAVDRCAQNSTLTSTIPRRCMDKLKTPEEKNIQGFCAECLARGFRDEDAVEENGTGTSIVTAEQQEAWRKEIVQKLLAELEGVGVPA